MGKYKVSALERRIETYPKPKYYELTIAYSYDNSMQSLSSGTEDIIKKFFDDRPELQERLRAKIEKDPGILAVFKRSKKPKNTD